MYVQPQYYPLISFFSQFWTRGGSAEVGGISGCRKYRVVFPRKYFVTIANGGDCVQLGAMQDYVLANFILSVLIRYCDNCVFGAVEFNSLTTKI